jgi:hypothetical protein
VIFPFTCSGSNRNVVPVNAPICAATVPMSAFSKRKTSELVAQAVGTDERKPQQSAAATMNTRHCGVTLLASAGPDRAPIANQALPMLRKRLICLVGRQGLEPWTR